MPNTTVINGACPPAGVIDFVGYGNTTGSLANCAEGTHPVATTANTTSAQRNTSGCTDTDDNFADFSVANAAPRSGASTTPLVCTN